MSITKLLFENKKVSELTPDDIDIEVRGHEIGRVFHTRVEVNSHVDLSDKIDLKIEYNKATGLPSFHIGIAESLRRRGLGYKIYKSYINEYGVLTTMKAKWGSDVTQRIWEKLWNEPHYEFHASDDRSVMMVVKKDFKGKDKYINKFKRFYNES